MNEKENQLVTKINELLNEGLKIVSDYLAHHKGAPVLFAVGLAILGLIANLLPQWPFITWLAQTDILLHLSVIIGLLGLLIGDAL